MTIYKKIVFLLATVAFVLSCAVDEKPSQQGFIHLSSVSGEVPDELSRDLLGSYMVVLSCGDKVICSSPYNELDAPVKVACDDGYVVEAYNITSEQALEGRGRLRLYGMSDPFSIAPEDYHTVSLLCRPSNAKLTVGYTSGFLAKYSDVIVRAFEPSLPERVVNFDINATTQSQEQYAFFNIDEDPAVCVEVEAITSSGDTNVFSRRFTIVAGQWLKLNIDLDYVILTLSEPVLSDIYAKYAFISPLRHSDIEGNVDPSSILEGIIYEISDDGGTTWSSGNQSMISGRILFDGLSPSTTYQVRARYSKYISNIINFTTEAAWQLQNASFEEWKTEDYTPYLYTLQKYFPYSSSPYWDSNNPLTTVTGVGTSTKDNLPYKSFPMVTYIYAGHSGNAAQIMTLRIGRKEAVNTNYKEHTVNWGKLFLGTYGSESGRPMESRPSALSFWYTHDPYEGDSFQVNVTIYSNGTQIASGMSAISNSTSSWQQERVELQYSRTDLKATSIYVEFVSGTKLNSSGEPVHQSKGGLSVTHGGDKTAYVHRGSVVAIDDVELIYDNYN